MPVTQEGNHCLAACVSQLQEQEQLDTGTFSNIAYCESFNPPLDLTFLFTLFVFLIIPLFPIFI